MSSQMRLVLRDHPTHQQILYGNSGNTEQHIHNNQDDTQMNTQNQLTRLFLTPLYTRTFSTGNPLQPILPSHLSFNTFCLSILNQQLSTEISYCFNRFYYAK